MNNHFLIRPYYAGRAAMQENEAFLEDIHRQSLSVGLEIALVGQFVYFFLSCRSEAAGTILGQLYAHFPGIEVEPVDDYATKAPSELAVAACQLRMERKDLYPIKTYRHMEYDSLLGLSGVFSKSAPTEQMWIQLLLTPVQDDWREETKRYARRLMPIPVEPAGAREAMNGKFEKLFFRSSIRLACLAPTQKSADQRLTALVKSFDQFDNDVINGLEGTYPLTGMRARNWFSERLPSGRTYHLNTEELTSLYHLPSDAAPIANVVKVLSKKAESPPLLPKATLMTNSQISTFGQTNFRNQHQPFGIRREDRNRHMYIVGKTGMGKSKLLALLMLADIYAGKGFALLDPHGDLAEEVLAYIPKERIGDVVYFNPADESHPIGFNPLYCPEHVYRQHLVAGFIGIFKKLFAFEWTPRLEHMLRYTTLALLDWEGATVADIVRLLTDKGYRQDVIARIEDPVVKNFWTHEFATWNEKFDNEAIVPLLNKVGEFISSPLIRNCLNQATSAFTIPDIMEHNKILVANLSSGKLGEENSALLGSMLVTQIQQAAMARSRLSTADRKDFYLYVDEFQNFATSAFATILSEARKYGLCLTMAHQYIAQLNEEVQKTVFGNVGSIVTFRVGSGDAKFLETEFSPVFTSEDMMNLDARQMYLKLSIGGATAPPFSAQTITLPAPPQNNFDAVVAHSRTTYAKRTVSDQPQTSPVVIAAQPSTFEEPII